MSCRSIRRYFIHKNLHGEVAELRNDMPASWSTIASPSCFLRMVSGGVITISCGIPILTDGLVMQCNNCCQSFHPVEAYGFVPYRCGYLYRGVLNGTYHGPMIQTRGPLTPSVLVRQERREGGAAAELFPTTLCVILICQSTTFVCPPLLVICKHLHY